MAEPIERIRIDVSQESIQKIIQANVQMAVANALKPHGEQFVAALVERALFRTDIPENQYKQEKDKISLLESMVRKMIADEATAAIREWATSHRAEITESIRKAIHTRAFSNRFALSACESLIEAATNTYRWDVTVSPKKKE